MKKIAVAAKNHLFINGRRHNCFVLVATGSSTRKRADSKKIGRGFPMVMDKDLQLAIRRMITRNGMLG